jgi:MFS family permease
MSESKIRNTLFNLFPAMRSSNFRLFLYGQMISFAGTWLQAGTQGWLVQGMTNSAQEVATVASLSTFSMCLFSFFGGTVTDRFDKRKLLYVTQIAAMTQAFILGYLTITHQITLWEIKLLAFSLGVIGGIDGPARQSLMMQTTENREQIRSGTAINASLHMLGQLIGGVLASVLIPLVGIGGSFIINGLTFITVILTILRMRLGVTQRTKRENPFRSMISGLKYTRKQKGMLFQIILVGVIAMLGFSYRGIFPTITKEKFHAGTLVFGLLQAAVAGGALVASIVVSKYSKRLGEHGIFFKCFVVGGSFMVGIPLILFSLIHSLLFCLPLLVIAGAGLIMGLSTLRATLSESMAENMRGRVMGLIFTIVPLGMSLGYKLNGILAQHFGCSKAIGLIGYSSVALGTILYIGRDHIAVAPATQQTAQETVTAQPKTVIA